MVWKKKRKKEKKREKEKKGYPFSHSVGNLKLFCCKWLAEAEHQIIGMCCQFCMRSAKIPSALTPEQPLHCTVTGNLLIAHLVNVYYVMYFCEKYKSIYYCHAF